MTRWRTANNRRRSRQSQLYATRGMCVMLDGFEQYGGRAVLPFGGSWGAPVPLLVKPGQPNGPLDVQCTRNGEPYPPRADVLAAIARDLGATPAPGIVGLWDLPGFPELTDGQLMDLARQRVTMMTVSHSGEISLEWRP